MEAASNSVLFTKGNGHMTTATAHTKSTLWDTRQIRIARSVGVSKPSFMKLVATARRKKDWTKTTSSSIPVQRARRRQLSLVPHRAEAFNFGAEARHHICTTYWSSAMRLRRGRDSLPTPAKSPQGDRILVYRIMKTSFNSQL